MIEMQLHFASAILTLIALAIPIYLSFKLKDDLRKLTALLAIFLFIHATYHIARILGFEFLGESILEPTSVALLILFGVIYLKIRKKRQEVKT